MKLVESTDRGQVRWARRGRGQSLVEFALILPVFLLILFAIIDFGLALDTSLGVSNASREGARFGATDPTATDIEARVRGVAGRLNDGNLAISITCETPLGGACTGGLASAAAGDSVVVRVTYNYQFITPIGLGNSLPVSSRTEMRVE